MIEFDVHIKAGDLYDYMMRHTYYSFSGIFGSLVGALMVVAGLYMNQTMLIIAGVILLCYLPWTLFLRSRQQAMLNPAFKEPLHYMLDEEGIHVSQKENTDMQKWDDIVKAVSTGRSLIVYTSRVNACIFPKRDLGDKTMQVIQVLSTHLPADKVKNQAVTALLAYDKFGRKSNNELRKGMVTGLENRVYETWDEKETGRLGEEMGKEAAPGSVYTLIGDLGVGKTVFTQGFARGLGITEPVNSPTFTIVQVYEEGRMPFYHFDVYRIGDVEEMEEIGYEDCFYGEGVCLIEWANLIEEILPAGFTEITIEKDLEKGFDYRRITVTDRG